MGYRWWLKCDVIKWIYSLVLVVISKEFRIGFFFGLLFNSSSLSFSDNDLSILLFLCPVFVWPDLSSINEKSVWRCPERELPVPVELAPTAAALRNLRRIWKKYMTRATKQANPHIRKRPQKLLRWSRSDSSSVLSELQALVASHLSWIRWRSPFSDSARIAVDMSTAKGESRGNT